MSVQTGYDPAHQDQHDGAFAAGEKYEPDMGGSQPVVIFSYIAVLSVAFFITLGGLFMYFKWEAAAELERKVDTLGTPALDQLRQQEQTGLQNIDAAMKAVAQEYPR
ncbi:MAG: hypothetical protein ACO3JL_10900 [Myxococcota bacterium]